jgi:hypothetical protein
MKRKLGFVESFLLDANSTTSSEEPCAAEVASNSPKLRICLNFMLAWLTGYIYKRKAVIYDSHG